MKTKATKFIVCKGDEECDHHSKEARHGYLVSGVREGAVSGAFYSEEEGLNALLAGVITNFVTGDEAPGLEAEIRMNGLPKQTTEADEAEMPVGIGAKNVTIQINGALGAFLCKLMESLERHGFRRMVKSGRYALVLQGCDDCHTSRIGLYIITGISGDLKAASPEGAKIDTSEQAAAFLAEHAPKIKIGKADLAALTAKLHELFPQADAAEEREET